MGEIPEGIDIVMTHGPPYGILDLAQRKTPVGCQDLLDRLEIIKPKYHLFGHLHESRGRLTLGQTTYINASCYWHRLSPPQVFDYETGLPAPV